MLRSLPALKRFDIYVYRNASYVVPLDARQVPAAATVEFYKQGATSVAAHSVSHVHYTPIEIYDPGAFGLRKAGAGYDAAFVNGRGQVLSVYVEPGAPNVMYVKVPVVGVTVDIGARDRLVYGTNRPELYADPEGNVPVGADVPTDPSTGRLSGYVREYRFDYLIAFEENTPSPRLVIDAEGSYAMRT